MASLAFTSAGSTISIADPVVTVNQANLVGATYVVINEVTDIGEFGKSYNLVSHNPLGTRQTIKRKGSFNNGTIALQAAIAPSDPGQVKLAAAVDSDSSYCYKVVLQNGTAYYFTAQAMGMPVNVGGVDSITSTTCNLEIDSDIWKV